MGYKGIIAIISELNAPEAANLTDEQIEAKIAADLPDDFDVNIAEEYEKILSENVPGYKPLEGFDKVDRSSVYQEARQNFVSIVQSTCNGLKNVPGIENLDRSYQSLFYGIGNTPAEIAKKQDMARILQSGTAEEKHGLFLETTERMASFPLKDFRAMDNHAKIENLPKYLPTLIMAMEARSVLNLFKKELGDKITQEETQHFTELYSALDSEAFKTTQELNAFVNPYYALIDASKIPNTPKIQDKLDDPTIQFKTNVPGANDSCLHDMVERELDLTSAKAAEPLKEAAEYFKDIDPASKLGDIKLCDENGKLLAADQRENKHLDWAREGKTLYFKDKRTDTVMAFRDFKGDGTLTKIPDAYKKVSKPNFIMLIFDAISRAIRGKGLESVEKYNRYEQWTRQAATENREKRSTAKFNAAANAVKEAAAQRKGEKAPAKEAHNEISNEPDPIIINLNPPAEEAQNEIVTTVIETREQKGERLAAQFLEDRNKIKLSEMEWISKNPDAVRDGYIKIRDEIVDNNDVLTAQQQRTVNECQENIAAIEHRMFAGQGAKESSPQRQGSERVNEPEQPKKQRSAGV